jgi:glutathione S-transferase
MTGVIDIYSFANLDRSARVRWACAEAGIVVREHRLDPTTGQHKGAEFRQINPFGLVPGVRIGGAPLFDSVGILLNLVETHPKASALVVPVGHPSRPQFLSWLMWAATSLDSSATALFFASAFLRDTVKQEEAMGKLAPVLDDLQAQLQGRQFAVDGQFTLIDIVIGHSLGLVDRCGGLEAHQGLKHYIEKLASRPAAVATEVFTCQLQAA